MLNTTILHFVLSQVNLDFAMKKIGGEGGALYFPQPVFSAVCPRSLTYFLVSYYTNSVKTSLTYSTNLSSVYTDIFTYLYLYCMPKRS